MSRSRAVGRLIRRFETLLPGRAADGSSVGPFIERSRASYGRTRLWMNATGAVLLITISLLQGWPLGLLLAVMPGTLAVDAFFRRGSRTGRQNGLVADIVVMGVSMVAIGIPGVAAALAILAAFLVAILLDRRMTVLLSGYILACVATVSVTDSFEIGWSLAVPKEAPWVVLTTMFVFVVVSVVSRRVVETIGELESQRAQFMGGIVHDLRNPLTGVVGAAAVLRDVREDLSEEEVTEMIDMILSQAADANRMVEDLLMSARLDNSSVILETKTFDIVQLVQEVVTVMSTGGNSTVDLVAPDRLILAWGDPMRVSQVIRNLVSNASRYGNGHIRVMIEDRQDVVAVQVLDDGPGITQEDQGSLFEPFTRASQGRKLEASVGLGLSVSRRLARLMTGELAYRRVGAESIFELTIPAPAQSSSPNIARMKAITTDLAEVWLGDDGVLRVDYHPGAGLDTLEHAIGVVAACATIADGQKPPVMVITGGARPDSKARRLYTTELPSIAHAVAIVVAGAPLVTGTANLIATRMSHNLSIRVFDNQTEALAWLTHQPNPDTHPAPQTHETVAADAH
ncbi:MAG: HAMP domain-containing histidine kinase [Acidimicrobiia bacterium]|nr:HAMP domain-containing histidine kinase [Acidimicrobiia bacterium]